MSKDNEKPAGGELQVGGTTPTSVTNNSTSTNFHTLSSLLFNATTAYLNSIDPINPPSPGKIENDLLEETKQTILAENAIRAKGDKLKIPIRVDIWQIAQVLSYLYPIKRIAGAGMESEVEYDLLAIYQDSGPDRGIYVTNEDVFRKLAREYDLKISPREFADMMVILGDLSERVERCSDRDLIAVNNGIFNYKTKQLMDFSPDYVFTSKCRVDYNPNAQNVTIHNPDDGTDWDVESWMHTLSDDDEVVNVLWEILGAIIRPNVSWNKSAWFYSESGNNGKGTLCELMRQLCGKGNYASIPLSEMGKDFVLEPLIRTSAIIVDENDVGTYVDKAANLKALITHDVIQINRKFKQAIAYRFRGFMVQCLNEMPRVKDKSDSFYRRQLFVPFEKCFTGVERKYIKDEYLHRKDVLEYVLHKVLNMDYYNLSEPEACKTVLDEYKEINDSVRAFWTEFADEFKWNLLPRDFLFELYSEWYRRNYGNDTGRQGKNTFLKTLSNLDIVKKDWTYSGVKQIYRADKMNSPELLIEKYNLTNWMNPRYNGSTDMNKRCTVPVTANRYRGFERIKSVNQNI